MRGGYSLLRGFRASTQNAKLIPRITLRVVCSAALAVTYTISGHLLHLVMDGEYLPTDIREQVSAAMADPRLPEQSLFLMDMRTSVSLSERTPDDLRSMATFLATYRDRYGGRLAMVASAPLQFGLLRMGEAFSAMAGIEARAFYELDDAVNWLRDS